MKKLIALLLSLTLLCLAAGALAAEPTTLTEAASSFDVQMTFPDNTVVQSSFLDDMSLITLDFADSDFDGVVTIAPSEEFSGQTLTDLSDDEIAALVATVETDMDQPSYEVLTTPNGVKYIHLDENGDGNYDTCCLLTVYEGYFIQLIGAHDDFATITEDEEAFLRGVFETIAFLPVATAQ